MWVEGQKGKEEWEGKGRQRKEREVQREKGEREEKRRELFTGIAAWCQVGTRLVGDHVVNYVKV